MTSLPVPYNPSTLAATLSDRLPPHSIDAEQASLGCALISRTAVEELLSMLVCDDFYLTAHKRIFEVIEHLARADDPVDTLSVTEELKKRGELERIGGIAYILTLNNSVPTAAHVVYYLTEVSEKSTLRKLIAASQETTKESYEQIREVAEITERAQLRVEAAAERRGEQEDVPTLRVSGVEVISEIAQASSGVITPTGLSTGFSALDDAEVYLEKGDFIVAGGRPSMGKTSDWLQIAVHLAEAAGPVLFFSQEMSRKALTWRAVSFTARCDTRELRKGRLSSEVVADCYRELDRICGLPLYVEDRNGVTVQDVRAKVRRVQRQIQRQARLLGMEPLPIQLIVVDYVQLMDTVRFSQGHEKLTEISRGLKGIAREFEVPVVGLSQLSRQVERREDKRPMLSDLRESGSLEAEADIVLLYFREGYYQKDRMVSPFYPEPAETIVAKYRNGPVGTVRRTFTRAYAAFDIIDDRYAGQEPEER